MWYAMILLLGLAHLQGIARISHQPSITTVDMAPPASLRSVGRPRRIAEDTPSDGLGRKPCGRCHLSHFTTKAGEKSGLMLSGSPEVAGDTVSIRESDFSAGLPPGIDLKTGSVTPMSWARLAKRGYHSGQRVATYPAFTLEICGAVARDRGDIQRTLQSYYNREPEFKELNLDADPVASSNLGLQLTVLLRMTRGIAAGVTRYIGMGLSQRGSTDKHLSLTMVEVRSRLLTSLLSPWIGLGYAWRDVRVVQSFNVQVEPLWVLESVTWHGTANGFSLGLGLDHGPESGAGLSIGLRYLALPSITSEVDSDAYRLDFTGKVPQKTDMSAWMLTVGYRFNY